MSESATTVLLDYTRDKISVVDSDGTITYVNDAASTILGYDPDDLVGASAWDYVHPEDRDSIRETFERVTASDGYSEVTGTYRHETADGSWVWLESRMSNLTTDVLDGYVVSSRDVTDRIEAQRQASELRLQEIAERTSEVLWVFDGRFSELLFCNSKCADIYGVSVDELEDEPQTFLDCIHPDDAPAVEDAMGRLASGESADMEYRVNPASDYGNWVWVQAEPVIEDGEVVRIVGFARDVTDRKRRERQLAVMDTLLRHNLRNEMNVILSNAELIEERPDDHPEDRAALIRRTGERLCETAEKQREIIDLLREPVSTRPVSLNETVRDAVERLTAEFPDATIETDLAPSATAEALEQVELATLELLENALRHADASPPTADVVTRVADDTVELEVRDDCPPIPEPEYRVLRGDVEMTATYHSSGLGLWLVYWVVDLSNGRVEFTREADGNVATVTLPRAVGDA